VVDGPRAIGHNIHREDHEKEGKRCGAKVESTIKSTPPIKRDSSALTSRREGQKRNDGDSLRKREGTPEEEKFQISTLRDRL